MRREGIGEGQLRDGLRIHPARGVVTRSAAVLSELSAAAAPMTLSELARRTGLPKTTTFRLLGSLGAEDLVRRSGNRYQPGARLTGLAMPAGARRLQRQRLLFLPHLIDLYEITRQTVNLALLDGDEVSYVERIYGHNRVCTPSDGVDRAPAELTAAGKLLLAMRPGSRASGEFSQIREEGIAYSFAEFAPRVCCVAAPVRDRAGQVIAALAVAGRRGDFDPAQASPVLRRVAYAVTRALR